MPNVASRTSQFVEASSVQGGTAWLSGGVAVERVMTDNGSAYRSHDFRHRLAQAGIRHIRTRPYGLQKLAREMGREVRDNGV
jgi:hypothetical protein